MEMFELFICEFDIRDKEVFWLLVLLDLIGLFLLVDVDCDDLFYLNFLFIMYLYLVEVEMVCLVDMFVVICCCDVFVYYFYDFFVISV